MPKGTIHVISDIHGEDKKLRHVINNASGTLRPLVERLFKDRMSPDQFQELLTLIFYPAEVVDRLQQTLRDPQEQRATRCGHFTISSILCGFWLLDAASTRLPVCSLQNIANCSVRSSMRRQPNGIRLTLKRSWIELVRRGRVLHLIHLIGRVIRNLAIDELIIAGDCWDRGPRGDHVVEYLMQQPNVSFVWGNHDVAWLGACLGHEALICQVIRISLATAGSCSWKKATEFQSSRWICWHAQFMPTIRRPVFRSKGWACGKGITMARMQKAAAVMQFKFEGQVIARHPEWQMEHRRLLHRINFKTGTIEVDGVDYPLTDVNFPTIDPANPYELTAEERLCVRRLRKLIPGQPETLEPDALDDRSRENVSAPRRAPDLPRVRAGG